MRPYLRVANVFEDRIDTSDVKEMDFAGCFDRYRLAPGDVLLNEGQSLEFLGRPAIYRGVPENVAFTNTLIRFRPGPDITAEWALLVFRHYMHSGRFARESRITTNIAHLSMSRFKTVEFPVPGLREQRRIIDVLDEHLSSLDAARSAIAAAQRRLEMLHLADLQRVRRRSEELGPSASLGHLASTALGKMLDAKRQTGIPTRYLRNINVRWGQFDLDNLETTLLTPEDVERLVLVPGDIVACEGGEPGRCAVWRQENSGIAFQKALHRIRIEDPKTVQPDFVALLLEEGIRTGRWDGHFTGTTIRHLPQQQLRQLQIPVPPVAVQASLAAQAADMDSRRLRLAGQIDATQARNEGLRRAVLAAAFSGRLTGRSSDSELVEELADQEAS